MCYHWVGPSAMAVRWWPDDGSVYLIEIGEFEISEIRLITGADQTKVMREVAGLSNSKAKGFIHSHMPMGMVRIITKHKGSILLITVPQ